MLLILGFVKGTFIADRNFEILPDATDALRRASTPRRLSTTPSSTASSSRSAAARSPVAEPPGKKRSRDEAEAGGGSDGAAAGGAAAAQARSILMCQSTAQHTGSRPSHAVLFPRRARHLVSVAHYDLGPRPPRLRGSGRCDRLHATDMALDEMHGTLTVAATFCRARSRHRRRKRSRLRITNNGNDRVPAITIERSGLPDKCSERLLRTSGRAAAITRGACSPPS